MLPARLLPCSVREGRVWPRWLGEADHPWLEVLLGEIDAGAGQPERLLDERLQGATGLERVPPQQRTLALHVARHLLGPAPRDPVPRKIRQTLFPLATAASSQEEATEAASTLIGLPAPSLVARLFADLPGERPLGSLPATSPGELCRRVNLRLAQALVARSTTVRIRLVGHARAVVRLAKLRGLLCVVKGAPERPEEGTLHVSGPLALFHHTLVYGRALGQLLPALAWCERFSLEAECTVRDTRGRLLLTERDPLFPAEATRRFDSKLEARFARELARRSPEWELIREPAPLTAGETLFFPDFALRHRPTARAILVEVIGYWTADYLARKRAQLAALRGVDILLCVDDTLGCDDSSRPGGLAVLRFRKRVDPGAVLGAAAERLGVGH